MSPGFDPDELLAACLAHAELITDARLVVAEGLQFTDEERAALTLGISVGITACLSVLGERKWLTIK